MLQKLFLIVSILFAFMCITSEWSSRDPGLGSGGSSHALRHSAKRHMLAQEGGESGNGENVSTLTQENTPALLVESLVAPQLSSSKSGIKTDNHTGSIVIGTEGSNMDHCISDGPCSTMSGSCIQCNFSLSCVYGEDVDVVCTANKDAKCQGDRTFTRTFNCRYCYQTPSEQHTCQKNTSCQVISAPRQRYLAKCVVNSNVLCLGNRVFAKYVPCNWTKGYKWRTSLLLSTILGGFGVDRFYLGMWQEGIGKLFSFGGLGVWTLVDVILIAAGYLGPADGSLYIR